MTSLKDLTKKRFQSENKGKRGHFTFLDPVVL